MQRFQPGVHESSEFRDILRCITYNSVVLLDCDSTLARPRNASDIASEHHFNALYLGATQLLKNDKLTRTLALKVYEATLHAVDMKAVEPSSIKLIEKLKSIGIPIFIVTSRGSKLVNITEKHASQIGFPLPNTNEQPVALPTAVEGRKPIVANNIVYCDGTPKSACVREFAKKKKIRLKNVVFIDNSLKHVIDLDTSITKNGGTFFGIHYTRMKEREAQFKMSVAGEKLQGMLPQFADEDREAMMTLASVLNLRG